MGLRRRLVLDSDSGDFELCVADGVLNDDISIVKGSKFGESRSLQLRTDLFNAFQHFNPNPQTIGTALNSTATFGVIGNGLNSQYAQRIIQLSGKFYF